jgi:hypothetical protein
VRRFAPPLFAQLFCITLVLLCFSNSQGQGRPTPQPKLQNRDWPVDTLRPEAAVQPHPWERPHSLASLKNDFRQLQIVHNSLMVRVFDPGANERITNKEIRSSLGEIKKLAERVGYSFGLSKIKAKPETDIALTAGLRQLDKAVLSFVRNPLFQQSKIYDAEMASQAGRDLSEVLRLADVLRKLAKDN